MQWGGHIVMPRLSMCILHYYTAIIVGARDRGALAWDGLGWCGVGKSVIVERRQSERLAPASPPQGCSTLTCSTCAPLPFPYVASLWCTICIKGYIHMLLSQFIQQQSHGLVV